MPTEPASTVALTSAPRRRGRFEGLDCVDAASRLGISRGAVKKRAYRAGEELRRVMRAMAM